MAFSSGHGPRVLESSEPHSGLPARQGAWFSLCPAVLSRILSLTQIIKKIFQKRKKLRKEGRKRKARVCPMVWPDACFLRRTPAGAGARFSTPCDSHALPGPRSIAPAGVVQSSPPPSPRLLCFVALRVCLPPVLSLSSVPPNTGHRLSCVYRWAQHASARHRISPRNKGCLCICSNTILCLEMF